MDKQLREGYFYYYKNIRFECIFLVIKNNLTFYDIKVIKNFNQYRISTILASEFWINDSIKLNNFNQKISNILYE